MRAVDRVMRAYTRTHKLTDEQHQQVRDELSKFIRELMLVGLPTDGKPKKAQPDRQNAPTGEAM